MLVVTSVRLRSVGSTLRERGPPVEQIESARRQGARTQNMPSSCHVTSEPYLTRTMIMDVVIPYPYDQFPHWSRFASEEQSLLNNVKLMRQYGEILAQELL